jgi:hypothetical protein
MIDKDDPLGLIVRTNLPSSLKQEDQCKRTTWILDTALERLLPTNAFVLTEPLNV